MRCLILIIALTLGVAAFAQHESAKTEESHTGAAPMDIYYLEIVTPDVDAVCATYEAASGLTFGDPVMSLGNARTATRPGGGMIGVRAPMRADEAPVVRPYVLVEDIQAAVAAAAEAGAQIALPPMPLPGHGTCAIYIVGGVEHGLWEK